MRLAKGKSSVKRRGLGNCSFWQNSGICLNFFFGVAGLVSVDFREFFCEMLGHAVIILLWHGARRLSEDELGRIN